MFDEWWPSGKVNVNADDSSWYDVEPDADASADAYVFEAPAAANTVVGLGGDGGGTSLGTVATVGIVVAGALGIYLIYTVSKATAPLTKRLGDVVFDQIASQTKSSARRVSKHAAGAAESFLTNEISRRLGAGGPNGGGVHSSRAAPRHVNVSSVRTVGRD